MSAMQTPAGRVVVQSRAIVAADADVAGQVTVGTGGSVVHPRARIDGRSAPVTLGNNCIVEEGATIVGAARIGDGNLIEVGAVLESCEVGNCNTFEARCRVADAKVGNFCTVGAACSVTGADGALADRTVIYGQGARRLWSGEGVQQQLALHAKHLQYLRDVLPHAHKLKAVT